MQAFSLYVIYLFSRSAWRLFSASFIYSLVCIPLNEMTVFRMAVALSARGTARYSAAIKNVSEHFILTDVPVC